MKHLYDYKDQYGLICTRTGNNYDGGDTLANEFTVLYAQVISHQAVDCEKQVNLLRTAGRWIRHPDASKWYSNPECTSRDQLTPLIAFLCVYKPGGHLFRQLCAQLAKRGFLFAFNVRKNFQYPTAELHAQRSTPDVVWNYKWKVPDVLGPDIWAMLARGAIVHAQSRAIQILFSALLRPILWLGDLQLLGAAIVSQYKFRFRAHLGTGRAGIDHDDRNQAIKTHFAANVHTTYIAQLARLIYGTTRPLYCFKSFWAPESEPPIDRFMGLLYGEKYEEEQVL